MTVRPFIIVALLTAAIFAAAVPASAQLAPRRPPRPDWGIFASGVSNTEQRLVLTVNFGGGWEDDLGKAPAAPVDPSTPTTPLYDGAFGSAGASLAYTVNKQSVQGGLQFSAYGRNYRDMTDPFVGTYSASGNLSVAFGERGTLNTTYYAGQYVQNLAPMGSNPGSGMPGVPQVPGDPGAFTTGDTYLGLGASANYSHSLTSKLALTAAYSYYANDSWSSTSTDQRYGSQYVSAGMHYDLAKGLGLRAGYGTTIGGFGSTGTTTDYRSRNIDAGVDYNKTLSVSRTGTLSFSTGLSGIVDQVNKTHYYFVGGVNFTQEIGRSWNAYASLNRNTNFYQTLGQPTVTNSLSAGVGGLIGRRVSVQAGLSAYRGSGIATTGNLYDSANATGGVRVALNRVLAVGGSYSYYRYGFSDLVIAPPPGFTRQSDRQTVQLSLTVWAPLVTQARRANASR